MSDESTYETIAAESSEVATPGQTGDPADPEEYPDGYDDLEPEPDDDNVLPMEDGEGKADPADVLRLVREQTKGK